MQVSKYQPPYNANGRATFQNHKGIPGCYIIKINDKIRYIGYSATYLYKTLYRHFQTWNDWRKKRVTYKEYLNNPRFKIRVRIILTNTITQAENLEKALILKYKPSDNLDKLENYLVTPQKEAAIIKTLDTYRDTDPVPF